MALTIDVNLLNPFIVATLDCLTQMAQVTPARKRVFVKQDPQMHGDIAGIIGMTNGITGSCVVSFPEALARRIVARFLCEQEQTLSVEMMRDGIGEVANMVAGGAKRQFAQTPYRFDISTPTVVHGAPIQLFNPHDTVAIACEFTADPQWPETFLIEIALKPQKK
ncbi:MAG: chemotaxis protein CheX [Planctomycetota bacterium]|nr:chemotaxis protein CheX [Planctomycetota bacterium]MCX8040373.1 chemotaxis protein CheX [Planctomycetota bacterium]MDW8373749.1 chemotaxis protein CheX [Planctomycetota bacterium]